MIFCNYCANLLVVIDSGAGNKWACKTCPYEYPIKKSVSQGPVLEGGELKNALILTTSRVQLGGQYREREFLTRKEVDDVLGGEDSWKNVDSTAYDCPKECGANRAFYMQIQIRSADEPSSQSFFLQSTFYRCTNAKCAFQWREN
ncbi:BZ3500_MvSof-1268-A1-R1_Chr1-3g01695 [Microbotryum saponariae]|uniref:DNA-directed RNA polymerase subunit n=1 Tax=Microbotryum saponariae TaxID=289078 RepID=A0A2X0L6C8_9BASI|nr:BZ3500_MvSof-1268-A1-R1_Chr1-3g01695 [Microbotryum saponariae]SCZ94341.1 BZ3501_MvSof-1269-A2-R1_Chr1-3g01296 [Microbotryum saponariae]